MMSESIARRLAVSLLLCGIATARTPARTVLAAQADQIDVLAPLELGNYGRIHSAIPIPSREPLSRLVNSNYSTSELTALLSDPSPRIRVLALELLFRKQDPQLLPEIVAHTTDNEGTFDGLEFYDFSDNLPSRSRRAPQTVAAFANAMAAFYGVRGDFAQFWDARKNRRYWFGWLHSQLSLITGGLPTVSPGTKQSLAPFQAMLRRFPPPDRDLYLIWLQSTFTEPALADDAELSQAVRRLGRETVLAIAEGNPPGGDPDLAPTWNPFGYWNAASLVVQHANGVLHREDAPRLAAVVSRERERFRQQQLRETLIGTTYTIARASLLPEQASQILHAEIGRLTGQYDGFDRGRLAAALLRLRGSQELSFVRDFLYGEPPTPGYGPAAQQSLIASLPVEDTATVDTLLDDDRTKLLSPGVMAFVYQRFPRLRRNLLLDWFFGQRHDPQQMGNSIEYFLTILLLRNRDLVLMKAILLDPRLESLPVGALFDLEQKVNRRRMPPSVSSSFQRVNDFAHCASGRGDCQPTENAFPDLIRYLRRAAKYVDAKHGY
jgi:hypothetical protein